MIDWGVGLGVPRVHLRYATLFQDDQHVLRGGLDTTRCRPRLNRQPMR